VAISAFVLVVSDIHFHRSHRLTNQVLLYSKKRASFMVGGSKKDGSIEYSSPLLPIEKVVIQQQKDNVISTRDPTLQIDHVDREGDNSLRDVKNFEHSKVAIIDEGTDSYILNSSSQESSESRDSGTHTPSEWDGADPHWNFSMPWANGYTADYFKSSEWFQLLLKHTKSFDPSEPVITVCADMTFITGLLNWLISALVLQNQPPKNVLVVTNRNKVCSYLVSHRVPVKCLKLSADAVLTGGGMKQVKGHKFTQLLVIRLSVMRTLNHLGYDVLNMDTDAIVLKNPAPILEQNRDSDVIGTFGGRLPARLFKKWGLVVCMGTVLIRSTSATGM
jgi:hypothetical protein